MPERILERFRTSLMSAVSLSDSSMMTCVCFSRLAGSVPLISWIIDAYALIMVSGCFQVVRNVGKHFALQFVRLPDLFLRIIQRFGKRVDLGISVFALEVHGKIALCHALRCLRDAVRGFVSREESNAEINSARKMTMTEIRISSHCMVPNALFASCIDSLYTGNAALSVAAESVSPPSRRAAYA